MMQTLLALAFTLLILTGCSTGTKPSLSTCNSEKRQLEDTALSFDNYVKTLDQIPLPFYHSPLEQLPLLSKNYDKKAFERYKHTWTSKPLGILYNDSITITLIDCSIGDWGLVPYLTTYDKNGNKIDSLGPYKKTGEDMGYEAIEYLSIDANKIVTVLDSVVTYNLNSGSSDIDKTSRKLSTGLTKYKISKDGYIKEFR